MALLLLNVLCIIPAGFAAPRAFAPVYMNCGSLAEIYVWDVSPVAPFSVELMRPDSDKPFLVVRGFSSARPLSMTNTGRKPLRWAAALVAIDAFEAPGPVQIQVMGAGRQVLATIASEIRRRDFPSENIALDQKMSELRSKPDARKDRESAQIWALYQQFHPEVSWPGGHFTLPVDASFSTSAHYGDTRVFEYSDGTTAKDYHHGTDFAVPVGTPVLACAPGRVVLVADRLLTGITVVVEHAPSVYSVYFHLSSTSVKKGQLVSQGQMVARSGATGLVTGPHLHWEVRVAGIPVDALGLVTDGLLDMQSVNAIVSSVERSIH